jgi:hypothetical protein
MLNAWKAGTLSNTNTKPLISTQIREPIPLHFVLQPPEEQTDNWDDDFEEGISLTKLQGEIAYGAIESPSFPLADIAT